MPNSREWSCQIHENGHVKFTRMVVSISRQWSCQIHENGHVKFTRMVMSNSREWSCQIYKIQYNFYKIEIIKISAKIHDTRHEKIITIPMPNS